jgi:hypothetical protein
MKTTVVSISALFILGLAAHAEMRVWTSVKGDTVEAEFINVFGEKVVLKRAEPGRLIAGLEGLSLRILPAEACGWREGLVTQPFPPTKQMKSQTRIIQTDDGQGGSDIRFCTMFAPALPQCCFCPQ